MKTGLVKKIKIGYFQKSNHVYTGVMEERNHRKTKERQDIMEENRYELNKQLAQMLKGGVIMDVTTPEQAKIAEEAGACAVMALERIPADIRAAGGVSRMSDPKMIRGIQEAVSIPVMAKCRIGHFAEAQILEAIEIDYIDESEVLSPADDKYHIRKSDFKVPFVCGARDLGEALMMQLGAEGVFVGSGIFKSGNPKKRAAAIVKAVTNYTDAKLLAELSEDLGEAMVGINEQEIRLIMEERGQ